MGKSSMALVIFLDVVALFLFVKRKETTTFLNGQFLKHSTLFLVGFLIVHFQYIIDYLIDNVDDTNFFIWVNRSVVIRGLLISSLGLISFLLGYLIFNSKKKKLSKRNKEITVTTTGLKIAASVSLLIYFLTVNPLYLLGYYGSEEMGSTATYAVLIFTLTISAIIIQTCRNLRLNNLTNLSFRFYFKELGVITLSLIGVYLLSVLLSGDRGPIITMSLTFLTGYLFVSGKKISFKFGVIAVFCGALAISILGEVRNQSKDMTFSSKIQDALDQKKAGNESSFLPPTQELATSIRTLHAAINYVPEQEGFFLGRFQFQQVAVSIPFARFFLEQVYKSNDIKYAGSAFYITWINQGNYPNSGDGTSCVVDFYLDFGVFGVMVGMFLFGYMTRFMETAFFSGEPISLFLHVLSVVYISDAIYISRSSVLFELKYVIWTFAILYLNKMIFKKTSVKSFATTMSL